MSDSTPIGSYEGIVPFSGIFDAILQSSAQRAFMETEGMYTQAEEQFESAQRDLRDIQFTVPQDKQADAVAKYLRDAGYSSDVVSQTLGIPKAEVNAALMAAGYDASGQPLPEEDVFADTTKDGITLDDGMVDLVQEVPGVVTDDPNQIWQDTDKDELDLKGFIDLAFDVFGAYNKDAITNVVDLVNQRGISVGEVAQATGNSVESINQAATESGTAINNQGVSDGSGSGDGDEDGTGDGLGDGNGDGGGDGDNNDLGDGNGSVTTNGNGTVVDSNGNDTVVISDVFPEGDTVISDQPVQPTIITGPRGEKGDPGKTGLIMALAEQAPITEQMFSRELFEPQLRELANVPKALGMIQAIGRRFV
jgi:hypothetical protein